MTDLLEEENLKLVILEVGAGTNVPTVRSTTEGLGRSLSVDQCTVVRINPDFPHSDDNNVKGKLISIMEQGLPALTKIDQQINDLLNK